MSIQKQDHDPKLIALVAAAQEYRESIDEAKSAVLASIKGNEAALAGINEAAKRLNETGSQVGAAARQAVQDAARSEASVLAAPLQRAADTAVSAATATEAAAKAVKWAWVAAAFALGMLAGGAGVWWLVKDDLQQIRKATYLIWEQTQPPKPAQKKGG